MTTLEAISPMAAEGFVAELGARLTPGTLVRANEPMAKRTTLRVGGPAELFVEPQSEADMSTVLSFASAQSLPVTILGRGSNLLVRDGGIRGVVVSMGHPAFSGIEVRGERLHCGAGARLKLVANAARDAGLTGLEFLEGIPGSVGGALRMNAGAMGSWTFDVVERVRFISRDGVAEERPSSEVPVEYRACPLLRTHIALGVVFVGKPAPVDDVRAKMEAGYRKRWESQPAQPSAGCIFKNPAESPAGKLIDELGLKGTRVGNAMVSDVHANFIVNLGGASAREVLELIEVVRSCAKEKRGIDLQTEVEILGQDPL